MAETSASSIESTADATTDAEAAAASKGDKPEADGLVDEAVLDPEGKGGGKVELDNNGSG